MHAKAEFSNSASISEGTGLTAPSLLLILVLSLLLFLFWDGPLWSAADGASHFGRIFLSYGIIVPLAGIALLLHKSWNWARLATSTGLLWAVKLIITSLLFVVLASGTSQHYEPAAAGAHAAHTEKATKYAASEDQATLGAIRGSLLDKGQPVSGALVYLDRPSSGRPLPAPAELELNIAGAKYGHLIFAGSVRDSLRVHNEDGQLHTLSLKRNGALRIHVPIPPLAKAQRIEAPREPGFYELACENHSTELALLAVFDHPYFALTDHHGSFELAGVPVGSTSLWVQLFGATPREFKISNTGGAGALSLELSEDK